MNCINFLKPVYILLLLSGYNNTGMATKLKEASILDKDFILLHFVDGEVKFIDDGIGEGAFSGTYSDSTNSYRVLYGEQPVIASASVPSHWKIISKVDSNYGIQGVHPINIYRKSRVNGMRECNWVGNDWRFEYTYDHFIYLELPVSMEQGKTYTVIINPAMNSDKQSIQVTFDIYNSVSEAIHTNLLGYPVNSKLKAVDIYHFLGDGGDRNYKDFSGNKVYLYNVDYQESIETGNVKFWMKEKTETQWNLTGSDVWNADITGAIQPGKYRVAIEGIGCSQDFIVAGDIYKEAFRTSVLGYFYMRIGEDSIGINPIPRRPLWIPGKDPVNFEVRVTDMSPYHPDWKTFTQRDQWDEAINWAPYTKQGNPVNENAYGGHSDALDWDRHLSHVSNIYDLLLPYILTNGALNDDDCRITESGNGIPDILDEARNEVDFWLRLRYGKGYSHGLTNPSKENIIYQADNTPMAAWVNSLNCAMMAYSFELAGLDALRKEYQDSAIVAFNYANSLSNPMLDAPLELGQATARGRDFKMMAAAFLYNLTGFTKYEDIVKDECMVKSPKSEIFHQGLFNQIWGAVAYLLTKREIHYPDLHQNIKASIIHQAKLKEANMTNKRPSRRGHANDQATAWFQTVQDMPRTLVAYAVTEDSIEKEYFYNALLLEADWSLGRNPLNIIQMTTATTNLEPKRSIENCYTSGRDDGTPGLHPGHTPYLNTESWGHNMAGNNPAIVLDHFYPDFNQWPHASKYINSRFMWAHSEFTPRQTMRGKTALYAYLYGLSKL